MLAKKRAAVSFLARTKERVDTSLWCELKPRKPFSPRCCWGERRRSQGGRFPEQCPFLTLGRRISRMDREEGTKSRRITHIALSNEHSFHCDIWAPLLMERSTRSRWESMQLPIWLLLRESQNKTHKRCQTVSPSQCYGLLPPVAEMCSRMLQVQKERKTYDKKINDQFNFRIQHTIQEKGLIRILNKLQFNISCHKIQYYLYYLPYLVIGYNRVSEDSRKKYPAKQGYTSCHNTLTHLPRRYVRQTCCTK